MPVVWSRCGLPEERWSTMPRTSASAHRPQNCPSASLELTGPHGRASHSTGQPPSTAQSTCHGDPMGTAITAASNKYLTVAAISFIRLSEYWMRRPESKGMASLSAARSVGAAGLDRSAHYGIQFLLPAECVLLIVPIFHSVLSALHSTARLRRLRDPRPAGRTPERVPPEAAQEDRKVQP